MWVCWAASITLGCALLHCAANGQPINYGWFAVSHPRQYKVSYKINPPLVARRAKCNTGCERGMLHWLPSHARTQCKARAERHNGRESCAMNFSSAVSLGKTIGVRVLRDKKWCGHSSGIARHYSRWIIHFVCPREIWIYFCETHRMGDWLWKIARCENGCDRKVANVQLLLTELSDILKNHF